MKIFYFFILLIAACGPLPGMKSLVNQDLLPPEFSAATVTGANGVELDFNEEVFCDLENIALEPGGEVRSLLVDESSLVLETSPLEPGKEYNIHFTVSDKAENSITMSVTCYGFNPEIPEVLINEFISQGSSSHPDIVELKVLTKGNMAGVTFYQGTPNQWSDRFIFQSLEVEPGDFLLIHFKPTGLGDEVDEWEGKGLSGGLDSSTEAYDFWLKGSKGLSGNNGAISLFSIPGGVLLDGVLYSNRTSFSDERYRGFGSTNTLNMAEELAAMKGWKTVKESIAPEDGVNPDPSTSTRSICRTPGAEDTNSKEDWHIVPTSTSTFGSENSTEVYIPK